MIRQPRRRFVRVLNWINWQSKIWQRKLSLWLVSWMLLLAVIQKAVEQTWIVLRFPRICTRERILLEDSASTVLLLWSTQRAQGWVFSSGCVCPARQFLQRSGIQTCFCSQMTSQYVLGVYFMTSVTKVGGVTSWNSNLIC